MKLYLTRHKFSNTFTEDLWAALAEASNKPIANIMTGWTKQMGFPVIGVSARQLDGNRRVLQVCQHGFHVVSITTFFLDGSSGFRNEF